MLRGFLVVFVWALYLTYLFACVGLFVDFKWHVLSGKSAYDWAWRDFLWPAIGLIGIVASHLLINRFFPSQEGVQQTSAVSKKPDNDDESSW